jgi:hypothetical protein
MDSSEVIVVLLILLQRILYPFKGYQQRSIFNGMGFISYSGSYFRAPRSANEAGRQLNLSSASSCVSLRINPSNE